MKRNIKTLELTKDVLYLISNIRFQDMPSDNKETMQYAIDMNNIFGGNFLYETVAYITGYYGNTIIKGTECDAMGPDFIEEAKSYFYALSSYVYEHVDDIENIVHQFIIDGGLKEGTYVYSAKTGLWKYKDGFVSNDITYLKNELDIAISKQKTEENHQ